MVRDLKPDIGNSEWNIYENCERKLNALYVFNVIAMKFYGKCGLTY